MRLLSGLHHGAYRLPGESVMLKILPWLVVGLLLMFAGAAIAEWFDEDVVEREVVTTVVRNVMPEEYREVLAEYSINPGGLRGFIEGIEERPPEVITIIDTLPAPPPDTVLGPTVFMDSRGRLTFELLTSASDSLPLYTRQIRERSNVVNCDEGFSIQNGRVLCDPSRFGHLYLVPRVGWRSVAPGIDWEPSYRSLWQFSVAYVAPYDRSVGDRFDFWIGRRIRLW